LPQPVDRSSVLVAILAAIVKAIGVAIALAWSAGKGCPLCARVEYGCIEAIAIDYDALMQDAHPIH
jgi:hypothetical protein